MPARSISRWEAISASFGVSLRMGRKKRDRRMGYSESFADGLGRVKPDRPPKNKGYGRANLPKTSQNQRDSPGFRCRSHIKGQDQSLGRHAQASDTAYEVGYHTNLGRC